MLEGRKRESRTRNRMGNSDPREPPKPGGMQPEDGEGRCSFSRDTGGVKKLKNCTSRFCLGLKGEEGLRNARKPTNKAKGKLEADKNCSCPSEL